LNDENSEAVSTDSVQAALAKVTERFEELKKRIGDFEDLMQVEQGGFETKFQNVVKMKRWM
jgi:hypothetical protein